jgi:hypothetical protein
LLSKPLIRRRDIRQNSEITKLVGPAELPTDKQIKALTRGGTIEHSDVFPCLSHRIVSNNNARQVLHSDFASLEHSAYVGRLRLGRYLRVGVNLYVAHDARNQLLGHFGNRTDALAAFDPVIVGSER